MNTINERFDFVFARRDEMVQDELGIQGGKVISIEISAGDEDIDSILQMTSEISEPELKTFLTS